MTSFREAGLLKLVLAGNGNLRHGHRPELEFRRHEILLGIQHLIPRHRLSRIGRDPPHDAHQRAFCYGSSLVRGFAAAYALDQIDVLLLIRIGFGAAVTPLLARADSIAAVAESPGAHDGFADIVGAVIDLPALAEHPHAVCVLELRGEVVVNVAIDGFGARLASAEAGRLDRVVPPTQLMMSRLWRCCSTM